MSFLLSLAPYAAFFAVMRADSVEAGLWAAFAVGLASILILIICRREVKLLQGGTLALFAVLALFTATTHWQWSVMTIRLAMNAWLLAIVLASLAAGRPFTMEYARKHVPQAFWQSPLFISVNRHITWVWAGAFATLAANSGADLLLQGIPPWVDAMVSLAVLAAAIRFTTWYPGWARRRAGNPWRPVVRPSGRDYS